MTNLYPVGDITQTAGEGPGQPGAAPVGSTMQGNPQASQYTPSGAHVPGPQTTSAQLLATQCSNGAIPLHVHPTTVAGPPGVDSLLAQMSRGQVIFGQSTYGQSAFIPANGGAGPQNVTSGVNLAAVATGQANGIAVGNPPVYTGT